MLHPLGQLLFYPNSSGNEALRVVGLGPEVCPLRSLFDLHVKVLQHCLGLQETAPHLAPPLQYLRIFHPSLFLLYPLHCPLSFPSHFPKNFNHHPPGKRQEEGIFPNASLPKENSETKHCYQRFTPQMFIESGHGSRIDYWRYIKYSRLNISNY